MIAEAYGYFETSCRICGGRPCSWIARDEGTFVMLCDACVAQHRDYVHPMDSVARRVTLFAIPAVVVWLALLWRLAYP